MQIPVVEKGRTNAAGKTMNIYLGIDPGYGGAIARWAPESPYGVGVRDESRMTLTLFDMPLHTITVNGKRKNRLDLYTLATWFDCYGAGATRAVIEEPNAFPGESPVASFNFGGACLAMQAFVAAHLIPVVLFKPSMWKKVLGIPGGPGGKDTARRKASQLFPYMATSFARKCDDGRAEATLLAWYGARML